MHSSTVHAILHSVAKRDFTSIVHSRMNLLYVHDAQPVYDVIMHSDACLPMTQPRIIMVALAREIHGSVMGLLIGY